MCPYWTICVVFMILIITHYVCKDKKGARLGLNFKRQCQTCQWIEK